MLRWSGVVVFVLAVAAMAFAIFEPIQVLPRIRLAPGYALVDQHGERVTSEDGRGALTIYSFAPLGCDEDCADMYAAMAEVRDRVASEVDLAGVELRLVTISLDPVSDGTELGPAAERSGADGETWRWIGGDEDAVRTVVGSGFGRYHERTESGDVRFDPGFVLVDGAGVVRGDYRYRTLAGDGDKLARHLDILGEELRNADGPTAVAYEAAHLFLCYP